MDILGIGPLELILILVIALIVLGPNDMVKTGKTIGRFLRKLVLSPGWQTIQATSREIRHLPNRLMREAGLDEIKESLPTAEEIRQEMGVEQLKQDMAKDAQKFQADISDWTTPPPTIAPPETPVIPEEADER
jgi:Sec-independent protein translocase protein TatA